VSYPLGQFVLLQHIEPVPNASGSVPVGQGPVGAEVGTDDGTPLGTDDGPTVGADVGNPDGSGLIGGFNISTGDADAIDVEVSNTPAQR
jgi:hypothetical protein